MTSIKDDLYNQLVRTLPNCGPFGSNDELKRVFVDDRIAPWANEIKDTPDTHSRVLALIAFLNGRTRVDTGKSALVLFLNVLSDQKHPLDSCHNELAELADELHKSNKKGGLGKIQVGKFQIANITISIERENLQWKDLMEIMVAFGAALSVSVNAILLYSIYRGSTVFDLGLPDEAVLRLQNLLQTNDAALHLLQIYQVKIETVEYTQNWILTNNQYILENNRANLTMTSHAS